MRQAVTPHERPAATLRFLATGRSYEDLKFSTIMSPQALGKIIPETCRAIYKVLKEYCEVRVCNVKNIINSLLLWAICNTDLLKFPQYIKIDILYGNNIGQCHKQHCH